LIRLKNCRVCGFDTGYFPWGVDDNTPSYGICPCCGVEFGNEDYTLDSLKEYRTEWISKGAKWFLPDQKPSYWSLENQLLQIMSAYL
jgi:hypothetical protein